MRLDGYRHRPHHTVGLPASGERTIALLIVPPRTDRELARAAMSAAADPKGTATLADLQHRLSWMTLLISVTAQRRHLGNDSLVRFQSGFRSAGSCPEAAHQD
ncbi:hypothetical protein HGA07_29415 [Nocardia veterana]|uniref:Uncharacterized protein n=1 Tax=Nocardia veterana TaxID=132249 RepID=A0A7X6M3I1_9NOCA|nr:hypothetical protein [Nocardia veterana]